MHASSASAGTEVIACCPMDLILWSETLSNSNTVILIIHGIGHHGTMGNSASAAPYGVLRSTIMYLSMYRGFSQRVAPLELPSSGLAGIQQIH